MRFLADANIEAGLVFWMRAEGLDVLWAAELAPSTTDQTLVSLASQERRILITYDRDFGELIFYRRQVAAGVVLLRLGNALQCDRLAIVRSYWPEISRQVSGNFLVVSERSIRVRPLPI